MAVFPLVLQAQTDASLGIGVGTVRYAGGSSFSAASLSPAGQRLSPSLSLSAGGSLSLLGEGVWAGQGSADVWAVLLGARAAGTRVAVSVNLSASTRTDGVGSGGGSAVVEVLRPLGGGRGGAAIGGGPSLGVIEGEPGIASPHFRARGWWLAGPVQLSLSVEPTRFAGAWYTDVTGEAVVDRGRLVASLSAGGRLSGAYGSKGTVSAALRYFITHSVAIEASGGSYLADPFQGLPRAGFVSVGVRVHRSRRLFFPAPLPPGRLAPLVAQRLGDSVVVRFRMDSAGSVAIAGDWNAWRPAPLRAVDSRGFIWEAAFVLAPGTYHFNLLVDGTKWVVPAGVPVVSDGLGGMVAVLTVLDS